MSPPKSVTKVITKKGKTSVTYESNLDASQYFMFELSRAALRDVAKFVCKLFRTKYYQNFTKRTGNAGKAVKYVVYSSKDTKYPHVDIGLRTGSVPGFYALFQEFGAYDGKIPKLGLLTHAVEDNVPEIVKIESQYLSGLEEEAARLEAMVNEAEMEGDADD